MRPLQQGLSSFREHIFIRNGIYYFRLDVPADLIKYFPATEIKRSLRTSDIEIAKLAANGLELKAQQAYAMLRAGMLFDEMVKQLVETVMPDTRKATDLVKKSKQLSNVIKAYTDEKQSGWSEKTKMEISGMFRLLMDVIGNVDISLITRPVMIELRSTMMKIPPNVYKKYPDRSVRDVIASSTEAGMSIKSVNKHIARLGSLLRYCNDVGMILNNPASGLKLSEKQRADQERNVYAPEDIKKIVCGLPVSGSYPERYWIPLIGLFSGLRLNEISQLYVEDVMTLEGCWCFDINADKNKRLKNSASERVIPIHPKLIELGLIQYCENIKTAGHPRLWMNLEWADISGYTNSICKWYQRYNRLNVTKDPKKVFHSMRHTVADTLKQKGISEVIIAEVLGHTHTSITSGRYGKRYQPKILLDALMQLDYDVKIQPWDFAAR